MRPDLRILWRYIPHLRSETLRQAQGRLWGTQRLVLLGGLKSEDGAGHVSAGNVRRNLVWCMGRRLVWGGQGGSGFFDDGRWRAGVRALGQFGGGEELGVATGAVA